MNPDITERLKADSAEWAKCEECIDVDASLKLSALLDEAAEEIKRLRAELDVFERADILRRIGDAAVDCAVLFPRVQGPKE